MPDSQWKTLGPEYQPLVKEIRDGIFHARLRKRDTLRYFPRFKVKVEGLPRDAMPSVALWAPDASACLNLAPGGRHVGPAGACYYIVHGKTGLISQRCSCRDPGAEGRVRNPIMGRPVPCAQQSVPVGRLEREGMDLLRGLARDVKAWARGDRGKPAAGPR